MSIPATGHVPSNYHHASLRPRARGEPCDRRVSREFWYVGDDGVTVYEAVHKPGQPDTKVGAAIMVGECTKQDPMTEQWFWAECWEVTLFDGRVVPCTRLKGGGYVLCQDLSWRMS